MKKVLSYLLLIISILITSCAKDVKEVTPELTINIASPQQNAVYRQGDTVFIKANINSPVDLHGYSWQIINIPTGAILASGEAHTHGKTVTVEDKWLDTLSATINVSLKLTAEIDHDGNEKSQSVNFTLDK